MRKSFRSTAGLLLAFLLAAGTISFGPARTHAAPEYYTTVKQSLNTEFGLPTGGTILFGSTENAAYNQFVLGGGEKTSNDTMTVVSVANQPFNYAMRFKTANRKSAPWSLNAKAMLNANINSGDVLLGVVYARSVTANNPDAETYASFAFKNSAGTSFTTNKTDIFVTDTGAWKRYFFRIQATSAISANGGWAEFFLGQQQQEIELGGFALINYGSGVSVGSLPDNTADLNYDGRAANAPWRAQANARIEQLRKGDFTINVTDANNAKVTDATVTIHMKKHAFPFGSAVPAGRIIGTSGDDAQFRSKFLQNFNKAVLENDMKWVAWEGGWGWNGKQYSLDAYNWLQSQGIPLRGHVLIYGNWGAAPSDVSSLTGQALYDRIKNHIFDEAGANGMKGKITDWDVINENLSSRDFINGVQSVASGNTAIRDWFDFAKQADPAAKRIYTDAGMLGRGKAWERQFLVDTLTNLNSLGTQWDGIGEQAHFDIYNMPGIPKVLSILDSMQTTFNKPVSITEFDFDIPDRSNPAYVQVQADYTRDFITAVFSHPNVDQFLSWGFWENSHWLPKAAYYNADWSIRPNGQAYRDTVYGTFWTSNLQATYNSTNQNYKARGFLGDYDITVTRGSTVKTVSATLVKGGTTVNIQLGAQDQKLTGAKFGATPAYAAGSEYDKAFDGNTGTFYDYANPNGGYTGIDLGSGNAKKITKVRFYPRSGFAYRMTGGKFQGSNTSATSGFVDLATIQTEPAGNQWTELAVTNANAYRYLRYLAPDNGYGNVAEVEFYGAAQTESKVAGTAFGGTPAWAAGSEFDKAFDGNTGTYYDYAYPNGGFAGIDAGSGNAKRITKVRYYPRSGFASRMTGGKFQGSNTSTTSGFVDLATIQSEPADGAWSELTVSDTGSYRYIRYLAPDNGYGNVAELEFYSNS